jgi:hypothetical protein
VSPDQASAARNSLTSALSVLAGISFGGALGGLMLERNSALISSYFFSVQDAPVLFVFGLFFVILAALLRTESATFASVSIGPRVFAFFWITLIAACSIIWAGSRFVYLDFGLSLDEFMAKFDSRIIAAGRLLASVPADWRTYVPSLQPIFRLELPDNAYWSSAYLPMNAAIRAAFVWLGEPAWQGIVLAAIALVALLGVARRLWPDRPDAAVVSIVLLVCSSQFLITAMTPYAMTAHLAFNMVWLWLFLRDTRLGHALAVVVAFVACGLHQVVFHPLFAAPFIVSLAIARRWKLASFYGASYAAIGLFWILYWSLLLRAADAPIAQSAHVGIAHFVERVAGLLTLRLDSFILMALNLFRFLAWQNPLTIPLAVVGLVARRDRNIINLAAGIALTVVVVLVLLPFQGHGWGYRYLHGFLGSLSLIAAQGWIRLTDRDAQPSKPTLAFWSSVLVSLFVLLPWRAWQVHAFVEPYAAAVAAIKHSRADVVIVDPTDIWYGEDLVRNDPFLRTPPKVVSLPRLDETRLSELCRRHQVAIFDREDARRLGIRIVESAPEIADHDRKLRALATSSGCGLR